MFRKLFPAMLLLLVGCETVTAPPNDEPFEGRYELQTVDGQALPWTLVDDGVNKIDIVGAHFLILSDRTYVNVLELSGSSAADPGTEFSLSIEGAWKRNAGTVTFTPEDEEPYTASWNGHGTITLNDEGHIMVWKK